MEHGTHHDSCWETDTLPFTTTGWQTSIPSCAPVLQVCNMAYFLQAFVLFCPSFVYNIGKGLTSKFIKITNLSMLIKDLDALKIIFLIKIGWAINYEQDKFLPNELP